MTVASALVVLSHCKAIDGLLLDVQAQAADRASGVPVHRCRRALLEVLRPVQMQAHPLRRKAIHHLSRDKRETVATATCNDCACTTRANRREFSFRPRNATSLPRTLRDVQEGGKACKWSPAVCCQRAFHTEPFFSPRVCLLRSSLRQPRSFALRAGATRTDGPSSHQNTRRRMTPPRSFSQCGIRRSTLQRGDEPRNP